MNWTARGALGTARGRHAALAAAIAAVALVTLAPQASAAEGKGGVRAQREVARPGMTLGFWAGEAVPGTDWDVPDTYWNPRGLRAYTPRLWRVLRRYRIPLYFNLRYRRDFGTIPPGKPHRTDALKIIRKANRLGVPVWGWILVPYSAGYWAWEGAAKEHVNAVRALVKWTRDKRVRLRGLALDPEPRLRTPFDSSASILGRSGGASFSSIFPPTLNPLAQCAAWRTYASIPRWAERRGIRVTAAPMPAALDDVRDGSTALQDAAGFVLPPAPWHELYFQVYRSVFSYYAGYDPGSGIVASYFRSAQRQYGSAGQVSFGSTGRGPYRRFATLLHDVRLAATLGARTLPLYSLERTVAAYGGPGSVAQLARAASHPFAGPAANKLTATTPAARKLRGAVHRADRFATASTASVTAERGAAQTPNRWPDGCGR